MRRNAAIGIPQQTIRADGDILQKHCKRTIGDIQHAEIEIARIAIVPLNPCPGRPIVWQMKNRGAGVLDWRKIHGAFFRRGGIHAEEMEILVAVGVLRIDQPVAVPCPLKLPDPGPFGAGDEFCGIKRLARVANPDVHSVVIRREKGDPFPIRRNFGRCKLGMPAEILDWNAPGRRGDGQ
jgi:hypothetical protein